MTILILDPNHPILEQLLTEQHHKLIIAYKLDKEAIFELLPNIDGIVVRSRYRIDKTWIDAAPNLKFIARVGAGVENIDTQYADIKNIPILSSPEGNAQAVGEHCLGMLLMLFNQLHLANDQINNDQWLREENRGIEISGKTIGLLGYGHMGKAFARTLRGFDTHLIAYDIDSQQYDQHVIGLTHIDELIQQSDVVSIHLPYNNSTHRLIDKKFIEKLKKSAYIINTSRGKILDTQALVQALQNNHLGGACLDVLEYEKQDLSNLDIRDKDTLDYLKKDPRVVLSPHVAGWTHESHIKLSKIIAEKIQAL